jgi:molecular chaperone DnaJ
VSVNIPCGVDTGNKLRVAGEGDAGSKGGPAGDLYIFLNVNNDSNFKREGVDIYSELEVSVIDAILGGRKKTTTLDEDALEVIIPAGTQPGTQLRLKGKGVPTLSKPAQRGTLYVTVNVNIPTELSEKETRLIEQLKALQDLDV